VEWQIGSTHGSGARGPRFDSHPDPDGFIGSLISLLSDFKMISLNCNIGGRLRAVPALDEVVHPAAK
jgi:hypothetical protein